MAEAGLKWRCAVILTVLLVIGSGVSAADRGFDVGFLRNNGTTNEFESHYLSKIISFLQQNYLLLVHHVWPEMEFGWRIIVGTVIGFLAAALGSVGGVGGGGIFVPMLTLIIGFDPKSSTAISKCMITGAAIATVYYNLKLRHPTLDLPIIDYDLALLFQPMLVLGISIGVIFNLIFADWMVTVLLIILFIGTSTKAFFKGVETWKKETIIKKVAARRLASDYTGSDEVPYKLLPGGPTNGTRLRHNERSQVSIIDNVCWKELSILVAVWVIILLLHVLKDFTAACSAAYWTLTLLQIPIAVGASGYEAVSLYNGRRVITSTGEAGINWTVYQLVLCCFCGILAGIVGGLLGLGGGFILGPLFLELGIPPQVSSATATFAMAFSSSMSAIQYYLLRRFPVPYALYFVAVATIAAFVGQHVVRKMISILGRASLIIFILAFTIFVSAISLGWVGISHIIGQAKGKEGLWFSNICLDVR
ncbi:sulfite exporter TauE/SafE family protein 3-like [Olea europaea var. sylvestris]|uniref:Sulfite exporter family 3-like n=1 Tax=Olea europaea subsp. europaea TaxID=158383 RepID=A0A8S0QE79_OLEEU|nr:sulfite exporter TauE/SafE family protein 3-like [Olea europaea var. sylvestris]XP_022889659.1 sulfite exporter TauE/SafE family protein 3-like [Olea europaea var. sylvestris]XP_022889660.1 sulfite exporter TauE/SafE family protein 3-like [Olea europaea var. sylvestris]CAA2965638.1 sulfite exporter family 3-like [Olea europaea subsp. europaea]